MESHFIGISVLKSFFHHPMWWWCFCSCCWTAPFLLVARPQPPLAPALSPSLSTLSLRVVGVDITTTPPNFPTLSLYNYSLAHLLLLSLAHCGENNSDSHSPSVCPVSHEILTRDGLWPGCMLIPCLYLIRIAPSSPSWSLSHIHGRRRPVGDPNRIGSVVEQTPFTKELDNGCVQKINTKRCQLSSTKRDLSCHFQICRESKDCCLIKWPLPARSRSPNIQTVPRGVPECSRVFSFATIQW